MRFLHPIISSGASEKVNEYLMPDAFIFMPISFFECMICISFSDATVFRLMIKKSRSKK